MSLIQTEINDGIAQITFNNPPLNVVTVELTRQLNDALDELAVWELQFVRFLLF